MPEGVLQRIGIPLEAPQRWLVETVNLMIKPNRGSALRGKTAGSRERDTRLKVLTLGGVC
jgi:hypothetical protein